jgi:hypothetical protein
MAHKNVKEKRMRGVVINELGPSAFLTEVGAVLKIGGGIYKTVKTVSDDLQGELVTRIRIPDSRATQKHHEIRMRIENHSRSGTYVESVEIQVPKMKKADASLTKDGVNLASKLFVEPSGLGETERTIVFPVLITSDDSLEFHIRINLVPIGCFGRRSASCLCRRRSITDSDKRPTTLVRTFQLPCRTFSQPRVASIT